MSAMDLGPDITGTPVSIAASAAGTSLVSVEHLSLTRGDSLINAARRHFSESDRLTFPARHITRPANAGGEAHIAVSEEEFAAQEAAGFYCLAWQAHGLRYGIPASALAVLESGRSVLVNVSRRIVAEAEKLAVPLAVLHVTARPETLAERLKARGRESSADIAARLAREAPLVTSATVIEVSNDFSLAEGERAFIAAIECLIV